MAEGTPATQREGENAPPKGGLPFIFNLIVQFFLMYYMWNWFKGKPADKKPDNLGEATPTPSPATVSPTPVPSLDPNNPLSFLTLMNEAAKGKRNVPADLQFLEDDRLERIELAKQSKKPLHPLWPAGTSFDIYIYMSKYADISSKRLERPTEAMKLPPVYVSVRQDQINVPKSLLSTLSPAMHVLKNITYDSLVKYDNDGESEELPLLWFQRNFLNNWDSSNYREQFINVSMPVYLARNESMYAHVFFCAYGSSPDPRSPDYDAVRVHHVVHPMVRYFTKKPKKQTLNLITGEGAESDSVRRRRELGENSFGFGAVPASNDADASQESKALVEASEVEKVSTTPKTLPYWKPTLHMQIIQENMKFSAAQLPPHISASIEVDPTLNGYKPLVFVNEFWTLNSHYVPLPQSADYFEAEQPVLLPLTVSYSPQSSWKWALQAQMQSSWDTQVTLGASSEGDSDLIKSILVDSNPILLAVTAVVSMLHMLFEFLAFRNDISFWRANKSLEGLSVRSLMLNFVQMLTVTLYLFDNETSYMVLVTQAIGLVIELWKLRKAISVGIYFKDGSRIPRIKWEEKDKKYALSRTKEYDDYATHHMLVVLAPLALGYAFYSLFYDRHKSWYSWIVSSAVNFVYLFGFVQLVPQLYINYRLKSVAHMPWRSLMYKFLTTIIDDLFAFVIKMPIMHRISVFRDDVIFILLLGQRWLYPVDVARKNEYGSSLLDEEARKARERGEKRVIKRGKYDNVPRVS